MFNNDNLNPAQHQAVHTTEGPLLVLAGAGSGKTRVLTQRIAHLVHDLNVAPYQILAITFTNKAAAEMRERLSSAVEGMGRGMWVLTFHAMCVRILRADAEKLGYTSSFTIYDDDDSKRLVKEIMRDLSVDDKVHSIGSIRSRISNAKNQLLSPEEYRESASGYTAKITADVYDRLQTRLQRNNAMDFDDLLTNTVRLFQQHPSALAQYQNRFHYIHVDEYQDTNKAQYIITKKLAETHHNLMVVGDDDQSIYSWRGADITNILEFERDYPEATVVKLEQNYRSTGNILEAANAVISNNEARKDKELFTDLGDGEKVEIYLASNEHDEARYIAGQIERQTRSDNRKLSDFAIFYRTNAQSRVLEDAFLRAGIGYRIVGGTRYFDRAEIRDVMAYLKVIVNPCDEISLKRIINTPRRGIGSSTIEILENFARTQDVIFETAITMAVDSDLVRPAAKTSLANFAATLNEMREMQGDLADIIEMIIDKSGLLAAYESQRTDDAQTRAENIKEFVNVAADFAHTHEDNDLFDFMEWLSLRSDLDSLADVDETVTLMTVHTAKGLEYPVVYVSGMEETIFPHANSLGERESGVEEERRLAYVAITRAREKLCLTYAATRMTFGSTGANASSRFISEIPEHLVKRSGVGSAGYSGGGWDKRGDRRGISGHGVNHESGRVFGSGTGSSAGGTASRGSGGYGSHKEGPRFGAGARSPQQAKLEKITFVVGDRIDHKVFGQGTISQIDGDTLITHFDGPAGTKNVVVGYAPIVKIG